MGAGFRVPGGRKKDRKNPEFRLTFRATDGIILDGGEKRKERMMESVVFDLGCARDWIARLHDALITIQTAAGRKRTPGRVTAVREAWELLGLSGDSRRCDAVRRVLDPDRVVMCVQETALGAINRGWGSADVLDAEEVCDERS
jgi:hypothetical protein